MPNSSAFALRMPPEFKDAAKALSKVHFDEPAAREGYVNMISFPSINEALVYLLRRGLSNTLPLVEAKRRQLTSDMEVWGQLMSYFLAAPVATEVHAAHLPEGSPARVWMESLQAHSDAQNTGSEHDDDTRYDVVTRQEAAQEYAANQRMLLALTEATGALQKSLLA